MLPQLKKKTIFCFCNLTITGGDEVKLTNVCRRPIEFVHFTLPQTSNIFMTYPNLLLELSRFGDFLVTS